MVTTVFNTGYVETSSSLLTLACVLKALSEGEQLWPQRSGVKALDDVPVPENPKRILCVASSHIGNNYAAIMEGNNLAHCMCAMKIAKQEIPHAAGGLIVRLADASVFSWGASK